ncbi:uncharacterized protein TNCV_5020371 [Trichonephila clavipes]|nr:uncharacterized protein TNCV_5020371 [Trichonephila clavipes]
MAYGKDGEPVAYVPLMARDTIFWARHLSKCQLGGVVGLLLASAPKVAGLTPDQDKFASSELRCLPLGKKLGVKITCDNWYPPIWCRSKKRYQLPATYWGCGSPVIKVSDHGRHVMSSSPIPLKTRRVGQRCTLNLSRAETSSRWCEGGFSYRSIRACVQRNSSIVMRVWKKCTDKHQTTRKTGSGRWKVTSARDDRHLLCIAVNDRTVSCSQLAGR